MCVAIYKSPKGELSKEVLEKCYNTNPDGAGFVLVDWDKKAFHMEKGFFSFDKFWKAFKPYANKGTQALVHFRVASHGKVNEENSHPHKIDENHYMIHNGVFGAFTSQSSEEESDTRVFVRKVLTPMMALDKNVLFDQGLMNYTQDAIGNNKVVILRRDGAYLIMNARSGDWIEENWFSNTYWKWRGDNTKSSKNIGFRHHRFLTEGDLTGYGEDDTGETIAAPSLITANPDVKPPIVVSEELRRKIAERRALESADVKLSQDWVDGNNDGVLRKAPAKGYWDRPEYVRSYLKVLGMTKARDPGRFVAGVKAYTGCLTCDEESVWKTLDDATKSGWLWAKYFKWADNKEQDKLVPKELRN